jgi:outer membrane receptor for ferrienterochelin and colicins
MNVFRSGAHVFNRKQCSLALLLASAASACHAADPVDLLDMDVARLLELKVSIASGHVQPLKRAAAVVSVITARDIADTGATELSQILESVPGLHVSVYYQGYNPVYQFRGVGSGLNPQVLMLLDGVPINQAFTGNRGSLFGAFGLDNVAQIEVIRGPGSALYGADAFAGTINIISKSAAEIQGTRVGARAGSFASTDGWIEYGGQLGPFEAALYAGVRRSDGQKRVIEQDLQSLLDTVFGTHATLSPGALDLASRSADAQLSLSYGDWRLRSNYHAGVAGLGPGIAESVGRPVRYPSSRLTSELRYLKTDWAKDWDLSAALDFVEFKQKPATPDPWIFPPGGLGGLFPDGAIGNPTFDELNSGLTAAASYSGFERHRVRLGAGYRIENMYRVGERKNFTVVDLPGVGPVIRPLPGVIEAGGDPVEAFLLPARRTLRHVFAQDEWVLGDALTLTGGVRRDRYSDFGVTTNPRLALVWEANENVVIKALHGRAFRPPSFVDEYPGSNPTVRGNPNLKPETIATSELVFDWEPTPTLKATLTLFHYRERDLIAFVPNANQSSGATARNVGDQVGRGGELEFIWSANRQLRLSGNYALQHSIDKLSGKAAGLAPQRHLYLRADWRVAPDWLLGGVLNYVAERARQPGDNRPRIADYATLDLSLRRDKLFGQWDLRAAVRNALDRDAREPSLIPGNIPFDLPLPGRAFSVELERHF